mgnify:CR=1 FL=1
MEAIFINFSLENPMTATATAATIKARKDRWQRLLSPGSKPGFCFVVHCFENEENILPPAPPLWPEKAKERIEYKWKVYQYCLEKAAWLDDDRVPCIDMITGTEIFAEALGCPVHRPADNMPFALPFITDAADAARVKVPELSKSTLAYLFDMADELYSRSGKQGHFHMIDVQSPMDIAALVWEKSSFLMGLYDSPEAVKELSHKAYQLLTAFLDEWFRRYGTEFEAHYPSYFMHGGMTLSEDEVGAVNAEIFEEFFAPELAALSNRYGGISIHCCADAGHQWENFRKIPGLRLLNLTNPPTRSADEYTRKAYPFFKNACAQWHQGWNPGGDQAEWGGKFPQDCRLVIEVCAKTREDAIRISGKLQEDRARIFG